MTFLVRLRGGERISDLCREFEISRKTAYKFIDRYEESGALGLLDQRRIPERIPHRTSVEVTSLIVKLRRKQPTWGPKKLQDALRKKHPDVRIPAVSTIGEILERKGLIVRKRRRKQQPPTEYAALSSPTAPNDLWCIDFKGEFLLGNGRYCYPLTVTDAVSRFVLVCEAFERIDGDEVRVVLESLFKKVGLPKAIRFDGGAPFASTGLMRFSKLSTWWVSLGIKLEQIEPGCPQQNGRHERMHRTLKAEATRPPSARLLQQQQRFDKWVEVFNHERPHEALDMKRPAEVYVASSRPYAPRAASYPLHDLVIRVRRCGHLRFSHGGRKDKSYFISTSLAGHDLGLRELEDGRWLVTFYDIDLGVIDPDEQRFVPKPANPDPVKQDKNKPTTEAKNQKTSRPKPINDKSGKRKTNRQKTSRQQVRSNASALSRIAAPLVRTGPGLLMRTDPSNDSGSAS